METTTFTLNILGNNSPILLQRIAGMFNRRRIHIKSIMAHELNNKLQYQYTITVETSVLWAIRITRQLEKQIDISAVLCFPHQLEESYQESLQSNKHSASAMQTLIEQ